MGRKTIEETGGKDARFHLNETRESGLRIDGQELDAFAAAARWNGLTMSDAVRRLMRGYTANVERERQENPHKFGKPVCQYPIRGTATIDPPPPAPIPAMKSAFDAIAKTDEQGREYWSAREL